MFWSFILQVLVDISFESYLMLWSFSKINPTAAFVVSTHAFTGGPLYLCQQPLTFVTDVCLFFFLQTVSSQLTYWTFPFIRRSPKCRLIIKHGRRRCVIQIREITGSVQHLTLVFIVDPVLSYYFFCFYLFTDKFIDPGVFFILHIHAQ